MSSIPKSNNDVSKSKKWVQSFGHVVQKCTDSMEKGEKKHLKSLKMIGRKPDVSKTML